jgi:hypothetical protein
MKSLVRTAILNLAGSLASHGAFCVVDASVATASIESGTVENREYASRFPCPFRRSRKCLSS